MNTKRLFTMSLIAILPLVLAAQLTVDSTGLVHLGTLSTSGYFGQATVNTAFRSDRGLVIKGYGQPLYLTRTASETFASSSEYGVNAMIGAKSHFAYGMRVFLSNNVPSSSTGYGIGVLGISSSSNSYNYGVVGTLGSGNGIGVFGTTSVGSYPSVDGRYAGYFDGNVKVTGTIEGTLVSTSDGRLKDNVQTLDAEFDEYGTALDRLDLLTPISYHYKNSEAGEFSTQTHSLMYMNEDGFNPDDVMETMEVPEQENQVMKKKHFGFVAQELQVIYPDLVYENDNGYLAVNYTELIPILVQSIKELKAELDNLKGGTGIMLAKGNGDTGVFDETTDVEATEAVDLASVGQNIPNPFTEKTDIPIYLPETVSTASLYIYDLSGKQLEQHIVEGRGHTIMTIHADKMDAGMYIYSLVADKKVVTAKKMIVIK